MDKFTLFDDSKYENHAANELPLDNPMNNDIEKASKIYRDFRESCGYKDPVALDEIEEAYYAGAEWMARQGYVVEDEIAMCYNNGEPIGLSLYDFDIDNNTIGLKDGDKVIIQVRKK